MKKATILATAVVLLASLATMPLVMAKDDNPANDKPNTLYLYEKDANWDIVWDGAWGKMNFSLTDTVIDFVFNGHGLEPNTDYTLISYTEPWPGSPVCLACGTSNPGGNVHLAGSVDLGNSEGIKIWLVLSSDVNCDADPPKMIAWQPSEYLFEHNLIPNPDIE